MKTLFDSVAGSTLAVAGGAATVWAEGSAGGFSFQSVAVVLGIPAIVSGLFLMAKAIFTRQERRIELLEGWNKEQQQSINDCTEEHAKTRTSFARAEETIKHLEVEVSRLGEHVGASPAQRRNHRP